MQQLSGDIPFVHSSLAGEMLFFTLLIGQKIIFYNLKLFRSTFVEIMSFRVSRNYIHEDFRGQILEGTIHSRVSKGNKVACCDCRASILRF